METIQFGYCDAVITPQKPIGLAGYAHRNECGFDFSGVYDDLYARVLSIRKDQEALIIITLDLCLTSRQFANFIRKKVAEKLQIPVSQVMLNLSHTHSGPVTLVRDHDSAPEHAAVVREYVESVTERVVSIATEAYISPCTGRLYRSTLQLVLGYNRRYQLHDEKGDPQVETLFSLMNHPGHDLNGVVDPEIPILMFERVDDGRQDFLLNQPGCRRVIVFSAPYHPVILSQNSRYVSADYPGAARKCIEEIFDDTTKAVFLLGPCGNTQPFLSNQNNYKSVQVIGQALGNSIVAALASRKEVQVDQLLACEEEVSPLSGSDNQVITQVFSLGDTAIAGISGECFTEMGLAIRKQSAFAQTMVLENCNGGYGYIPTQDAFAHGGYEIASAENCAHDEGLLERIIERTCANLDKLYQQ